MSVDFTDFIEKHKDLKFKKYGLDGFFFSSNDTYL